MKKKFTLIYLMVLLFGAISYGQSATATLATVTGTPGNQVIVPITVTDFNNVGAITLKIHFTKGVLSYANIINAFPGFTPLIGFTDTTVSLVWSSLTPLTIPNNVLAELVFQYYGTPTALTFFGCAVATGTPPVNIPVAYTNGAINPDQTLANQAQIGTKTAAAYAATVAVPLYYPAFNDLAGSLTQKVQFDPTKLTFQSLVAKGNFAGALASSLNGVVTIAWSSLTGVNIGTPGDTLVLNFQYHASGDVPLNFAPGSLITTTGSVNIPVSYFGGTIIAPLPSGNATLGSFTSCQGDIIEVPLTFSGFPANVSSFSLNINYQMPKLSFIEVLDINPVGSLTFNQTGNNLSFAWTDLSGQDINGTFLKLRFRYNGVGTAAITFGPGCTFTVLPSNPVLVTYGNGVVTPALAVGNNVHIGYKQAVSGDVVRVPITFDNLPTDIGAVTLYATFDNTSLSYVGAPVNPFGALIYSTGNTVAISWASITPTNINGTFAELAFEYNSTGAGCGAPITFADGCEIANVNQQIQCMNYHNGGVNMMFKISGILKYDGPPNFAALPLSNFEVYLSTSPEPVAPATTPLAVRVDTTITDANGYFEFWALNGTYYIYGGQTIAWAGVGPPDVTNLRRYIAGLSNTIGTDVLRQKGMDINQDGIIDPSDVTPLRRRIANLTPNPNYLAPDWFYQNPSVTVDCANMGNQDVYGICSGDANGSYPDPNL